MKPTYDLFITTAKGLEELLLDEIRQIGVESAKSTIAGVKITASLQQAYAICLWSRIANRVLLKLGEFGVTSQQQLYQGVQTIQWDEHFDNNATFAINFTGRSQAITHSHFGAQKTKDAIVDQFIEKYEVRPSVDRDAPDIRINVHLHNEVAAVSLDLSGESLHRRGYRQRGSKAPLKENLAAAILYRCNWPKLAKQNFALFDPMCGSGTFLIEGAMMAADYAPGLSRSYFGFHSWKQHQPGIWESLKKQAVLRKQLGLQHLENLNIAGFDKNPHAVDAAQSNAARAGLSEYVYITRRNIYKNPSALEAENGLVISNPPYGERVGEDDDLVDLYSQLGQFIKQSFVGWQCGLLINDLSLGKTIGIRALKKHPLYNGSIECYLLKFVVEEKHFMLPIRIDEDLNNSPYKSLAKIKLDADGEMFVNRLNKNQKRLKSWLKQNNIHCYRLYDADLPEFSFAVDVYQGEQTWVHVQEYAAPKTIDVKKVEKRRNTALNAIPIALGIDDQQMFFKIRERQKGAQQYTKQSNNDNFYTVQENDCSYLVNFTDYLDTGLFLDHRITRKLIQQLSPGKKILNLYAYTGSASVSAAKAGAKTTISVDLSNTYLEWAKNNFLANNIAPDQHQFIQADCMQWLKELNSPQLFDVIFMDPPTFSNSKRTEQHLDIQRDHETLIDLAMQHLSTEGVLIFSNNFKKFKLSPTLEQKYQVKNITQSTIPKDFERNPKIHHVWEISAHTPTK